MYVFLRACMSLNKTGYPLEFRLWSHPRHYGYTREAPSALIARARAFKSRQAFIPLIAAVSFFLHMIYELESMWPEFNAQGPKAISGPDQFQGAKQNEDALLRNGRLPSKWEWQEKLQEKTSISMEWLSYFEEIVNKPFVGTFIDGGF